jgi:DNA ligase-1
MVVSTTELGKFLVRGINNGFEGIDFKLGSGLNAAQRECFWENKERLLGKVIEYKYQNHGIKDAPRTPIFLRFRDAASM